MKPLCILTVFLFHCMGQASLAKPCVGPAFDRPVPGANDVASHNIDLPSVFFPGIWQTGILDGFEYRLFANGEGDLSADSRTWKITFSCNEDDVSCSQSNDGDVPTNAVDVAKRLQSCLLGEKIAERNEPRKSPSSVTMTPCGLDLVDETDSEKTLQRLLELAGTDVGPIDGIIGPQSQRALIFALGDSAASLSVEDATYALSTRLCS